VWLVLPKYWECESQLFEYLLLPHLISSALAACLLLPIRKIISATSSGLVLWTVALIGYEESHEKVVSAIPSRQLGTRDD
jgi:hypothetical protein